MIELPTAALHGRRKGLDDSGEHLACPDMTNHVDPFTSCLAAINHDRMLAWLPFHHRMADIMKK